MQNIINRSSFCVIKNYSRHFSNSNKLFQLNYSSHLRNFSVNTANKNGRMLSKFLSNNVHGNTLFSANHSNVKFQFANSVRCISQATSIAEKGSDIVNSENIIDLSATSTLSPEAVQSAINSITQPLSEISVTALNLGSNYTPIGWCLHYLDFLHSIFPWWASIAVGTLLLRITLFPLVVSAQKSAAKLNEILPEQAILKEKMNQARIVGDNVEFARLANDSHTLFKRRGINPIKSMLAPLAQAPVFLTFFLTLRRMANYPVESLKTGGALWFVDLSIPDPLYILPVVTSVALWLTLEVSFKSGLNPNQTVIFKYGARALPVLALIFTFNFPSAIMVYWCTNNILSTIQVFMLRQVAVRDFLNIPQIKVNPKQLDVNKKSFKKHFSETMENAKINRLMEERNTVDEISFKKAGIGPLKKTFKQDPTRIQSNNN